MPNTVGYYPIVRCCVLVLIIFSSKSQSVDPFVIFFLSCLPQIVEDDDGQGVMRIELQREKKGNSENYKLEFFEKWITFLYVYSILSGRGLGFNIRGGKDSPYVPGDSSIFVTRINGEGAAARDGRLSVGDKLLEVITL